MRVLLDTDVLLDLALDRRPHAQPAGTLIAAIQAGDLEGAVAWHSLANFFYLARPLRGAKPAKQFLLELVAFAAVAPASADSVRYAASLAIPDFEDALQVAAAAAWDADCIATRNLRDFARSPIPARTPAHLLAGPLQ